MEFVVKSYGGISLIPEESQMLSERKIFLEGEIDQTAACKFIRKVMHLCSQNKQLPIDVLINGPGGDINSGMLIYDVIQTSPAPIRTWCIGRAYSMSAVLLASAKKGNRYILPNSEVMIHEPLLGGTIGGSTTSIKTISESLVKTREQMNQILAHHTGKTIEEVEAATSFDNYLKAEEAVEFGLCDKIAAFSELMSS